MDQDPDALLDIVLRMDSSGASDLLVASFQDTDELSGEQTPVYTDLSSSVFDDMGTAPQLADLNGLIDIDNFPQVPFSPDAASLPHYQCGGANGPEWPLAVYNSPTNQRTHHCSLSTELQTVTPRLIQPNCQPSGLRSNTHETLPSIQFISVQHHNPRRHQHPQLCTSPQPAIKPKTRRRVTNASQRKAANVRERRRMFNLNEAFDILRKTVPTFTYEKRLSRIETLRLAMLYITFMGDVLTGKHSDDGNLKKLLESGNFAGLTNCNAGPAGQAAAALNSAASRVNSRTYGPTGAADES